MAFKSFSFDRQQGKEEWLTPPEIIHALGGFDLDPCAPVVRPWETAKNYFTIEDNGLAQKWSGRVWMNPPYGNKTIHWMRKLAAHGNGIALICARTETRMFFETVWNQADAVMFLKGRLSFYTSDGKLGTHNAGAPSCLVAYGQSNVESLHSSGLDGYIVRL